MVLTRLFLVLLLALAAVSPGAAHRDHGNEAQQVEAAVAAEAGIDTEASDAPAAGPPPPRSVAARALDWTGRLHPFAVHFPIALFPVAWVLLLLARRRGGDTDLVRSLVVVGSGFAIVGAALGWILGGLPAADPDWLHIAHRWLGTAIGLAGGLLGVAALRRPMGRGMAVALGVMTLALLVQGWMGAALGHGIDHLNW
jgi:hypothetical protein